jgi:hypothetical protein
MIKDPEQQGMHGVVHKFKVASIFFGITFAVATVAATPQQLDSLAELGQKNVDALKAPHFAESRCMLSPVFGADYVSVAVSSDRVFLSGDIVMSIAGERLDPTVKTTVRDVLSKHAADETVPVTLKRAGADITVNAKCTDSKPYYDRILEASYAASKKDPAGCTDKMDQAKELHTLGHAGGWLAMQCKFAAGKLTGAAASRSYYEVEKEGIEEIASSADALDHARGQILTDVDLLRKNQAGFLADDLKEMFDKAVAKAQAPTSARAQ